MKELRAQFQGFATRIRELCHHVSVRDDENGPFVFALGLKETHTLQLRKIDEQYVIELWYGVNSDVERVVSQPQFSSAEGAFDAAQEWLRKDAI